MDRSILVPLLCVIVVMIALSVFALMKLPAGASIPMQWSFSGSPTWFAAKTWGVWLLPLIAAFVLALMGMSGARSVASSASPSIFFYAAGLMFILIHAAHLWFAVRHVSS